MIKSGARQDVLNFYAKLPFNLNQNPTDAAKLIKKANAVSFIYPDVDGFKPTTSVLELGCGAGWLANSIAYYYGSKVTAIDFNKTAVESAEHTANVLGVNVKFDCADLFTYECKEKHDVVISNGVLHHTNNLWGGVARCVYNTKKDGKLFLGLYHKYGRKPFLDYFRRLMKENSDEEYLFKKYRELDSRHTDTIQAQSWFRDQVLHPYETQHTLKEIMQVFAQCGVELISTSINKYQYIDNINELYKQEEKMYDVGLEAIKQKRYYPGFFYVLGRKK